MHRHPSHLTRFLSLLPGPWQGGLLLLSLVLAVPVFTVFLSLIQPDLDMWRHLAETRLPEYVSNSLLLTLGVGLGSVVIGTALAWLMVRYQFAGQSVLRWLILLPLAMPAYIIAYTYTGMLDFAGPLQTALRDHMDWQYGDYWFPEIRSLGGAVTMMTLVLYPYVYILARTAFNEQSASLWEASRSSGLSARQHFFKVSFPLARPAIFTGSALAMMEALADYGTVQYFGLGTFTTGIFSTWFGLGNGPGAAQLSATLCGFVLVVLVLEKYSRRRIKYFHLGQSRTGNPPHVLKGYSSWLMFVVCALAPLLGFIIPLIQLSIWSSHNFSLLWSDDFIDLMINSFTLALTASLVVVSLALLFAYGQRLRSSKMMAAQVQFAQMGYAIPGTVIAVGVMLPLSWADHRVNELTSHFFDYTPGLVFSGTLFALILAYSVRFLSVALHNVESGLGRVTPSMDNAARSLGLGPMRVLGKVHVPIIRASVLSALLLVFVDVLKELPATLILRPFNFNTLAVRAYELASDERLIDAALPAISIVAVGVIPVMLLTRSMAKQSH